MSSMSVSCLSKHVSSGSTGPTIAMENSASGSYSAPGWRFRGPCLIRRCVFSSRLGILLLASVVALCEGLSAHSLGRGAPSPLWPTPAGGMRTAFVSRPALPCRTGLRGEKSRVCRPCLSNNGAQPERKRRRRSPKVSPPDSASVKKAVPMSRGMLDRKDAVKALGMASLLTGVMLTGGGGAGEAAGMGDDMKKMLMGTPGGPGYMTWRKFSEVESRAKDQNKGQTTYSVRFVTYLSRILVNYDEGDKQLWENLAKDIPFTYTKEQVEETRRMQFASFADSLELSLYDFQGGMGVERLFDLLVARYGDRPDARRQLAILFSFLDTYQPVQSISELLAQTDNAGITSFKVISGGAGYTGMEAPRVHISKPVASGGTQARAEVVLRERGNILRVAISDPGCIYIHDIPPAVYIGGPPPGPNARPAQGYAVLDGKGGVREVILTDPGSGYSASSPIPIAFLPRGEGEMELELREAATAAAAVGGLWEETLACTGGAKAVAVLDREVAELKVLDKGTGYVLQLGARVTIDPPFLCGGEPGGAAAKVAAVLSPTIPSSPPPPLSTSPVMYSSLTAQLQQLLPPNTVLIFDNKAERYRVLDEKLNLMPPPTMMMDPLFGSIGRSPLAKENKLLPADYARLALSGGCCICIVRTSLTPVEIIKTKLQARPDLYKGWTDGIIKIKDDGGIKSFYKGVELTALTGFLLGLMGFGLNEVFRRLLTDLVGKGSAEVFEIPIILLASAMATVLTALATCPLEAVRIRVMATRQEVKFGGFMRLGTEMVENGGVLSLYDGLEPLLFREVPFIMTKFLVFDLTQSTLFHFFPAARETFATSLLISFASGLAAGIGGAVTGCPADAVLTRVNSVPEAADWRAMVKQMLSERGGWRNLFAGVGVRMVFFSLVISIQFFLYDYFRDLFGVASEDLTLVLDVINSASTSGGGAP